MIPSNVHTIMLRPSRGSRMLRLSSTSACRGLMRGGWSVDCLIRNDDRVMSILRPTATWYLCVPRVLSRAPSLLLCSLLCCWLCFQLYSGDVKQSEYHAGEPNPTLPRLPRTTQTYPDLRTTTAQDKSLTRARGRCQLPKSDGRLFVGAG